ncbi:MAG TPA: hypothetical protein VG034_21480 [Acidimicrobiia bacterium]|nr:hypothetical protein [Acidimicrobiia bacterium]
MSYGTFVLVVAVSWLAIGLTLSLVMGRRGHDAFTWLVLGTLFGPLGASKALLGSTAIDLAEWAKVPVLLMGDGGSSSGRP